MKNSSPSGRAAILAALFVAIAVAPAGLAQEDFSQTVARVAFVQGDGSFQRGDDPSSWQPLAINVPMTIGDRVWTGAGRIELQAPGFVAFLAPRTELTALNLTEDVQQYSVAEGTATFRVVSMDEEDVFEIDTPNAAVTLERPGLYRVYVDADGNTRFAVRLGEARVAAAGGEVSLRAGEEMIVTGIDEPEYDVVAIPLADSWDRWVTSRERRRHDIVAYDYTSSDVVGAGDLDAYGDWSTVPQYGRVWRPRSVAAGWAPYRVGHWIWQDPWGWTWVSAEPWGWAPYHYGRWVVVSSRWCWVPVAPNVRHVAYAPALVAFVGGGPGWSLTVSAGGGGYVGWFPLAPRDPFVPWWGLKAGARATTSRVAYANRSYATVVARSAFEGARPAQTAMVRDAGIVRQVRSAAVVHGPLPILPTRESLRPTGVAAPHPPEAVLARPAAARLAPPPAPPPFERKLDVIREGRGAPLTPATASRLVVESKEGARAAVAIRPVVRPERRVVLAPRPEAVGVPPPDPVHAGGRTLATTDTPLIPRPSAVRENIPPARVAPGAVVHPQAHPVMYSGPPRPGAGPRRRSGTPGCSRQARAVARETAVQPPAASRRVARTRSARPRRARRAARAETGGEARREAGEARRPGARQRGPEERAETEAGKEAGAEERAEAGKERQGLAGRGEVQPTPSRAHEGDPGSRSSRRGGASASPARGTCRAS